MDTSGDWKPRCNHNVIHAKCRNTNILSIMCGCVPDSGLSSIDQYVKDLEIKLTAIVKTFLLVCEHCAYFVDRCLEWFLRSWMIDWCLDHWLFLDLGPRSIHISLINALLLNSCFDFLASYMPFFIMFIEGIKYIPRQFQLWEGWRVQRGWVLDCQIWPERKWTVMPFLVYIIFVFALWH